MTDITIPLPSDAVPDADMPVHPADVLLHLIITLLAPMFLCATGGNIAFARMAALETINGYRVRNHADLVSVAQVVAFGLAALGSLSLSMLDDLSLAMTLRLRGNANACNRSAEQNRRALRDVHPGATTAAYAPPEAAAEPDEGFDEAAVVASVAAAQERAADTQARLQTASPANNASVPAATTSPEPDQRQAIWAAAAAKVAAEYTADLANLPPAERRAATIRAAALSSCAHELLAGKVAPRPRPGDLAAVMRPNAI